MNLNIVKQQLETTLTFLEQYLPICNSHMVDYFTKSIYKNALPETMQNEIEKVGFEETIKIILQNAPNSETPHLNTYIKTAKDLALYNFKLCLTSEQFHDILTDLGAPKIKSLKLDVFMKSKKSHEVETLSNFAARIKLLTKTSHLIDIGDGKGYLSSLLAFHYKIPILGVDSSIVNTNGAVKRAGKLDKHWDGIIRKYDTNTCTITSDINPPFSKLGVLNLNSKNSSLLDSNFNANVGSRCKTEHLLGSQHLGSIVKKLDQNVATDVNQECSSDLQEKEVATSSFSENVVVEKTTQQDNSDKITEKEYTNSYRKIRRNYDYSKTTGKFHTNPNANGNKEFYKQITQFVTKDTNFPELISNVFLQKTESIGVIGLHTCGNLAPSSIRIFNSNPSIKSICNVSCCHHLLTELFSEDNVNTQNGFPMSDFLITKEYSLGRHARMLSSQSVERILSKQALPNQTILYRAIFEVVLDDYYKALSPRNVGRFRREYTCFVEYARQAGYRLEVDLYQSCSALQEYFDKYQHKKMELSVFHLLRTMLAPVIESILLLDRLLFLLEQKHEQVFLVQLFDPVISPRCYGLVAFKN